MGAAQIGLQVIQGAINREKGQAYGTKAKQATSALIFGKEIIYTHMARTNMAARLQMCYYLMD